MIIREACDSELPMLYQLMYQTVHVINRGDYSPAECAAWAPKEKDLKQWHSSFQGHYVLVAVIAEEIVGFGDITDKGYVDRLYVADNYQKQGIARRLLKSLEEQVAVKRYSVAASITSLTFFEKQHYQRITEQFVERDGLILKNFLMEKVN